jgi:hypothetical protein
VWKGGVFSGGGTVRSLGSSLIKSERTERDGKVLFEDNNNNCINIYLFMYVYVFVLVFFVLPFTMIVVLFEKMIIIN